MNEKRDPSRPSKWHPWHALSRLSNPQPWEKRSVRQARVAEERKKKEEQRWADERELADAEEQGRQADLYAETGGWASEEEYQEHLAVEDDYYLRQAEDRD